MYSKDLIERIVKYKDNGHTFVEMQENFDVSIDTYYDGKKKLECGYYDQPKEKKTRKRKIDKEGLIKAVAEAPDAYLKDFATMYNCTAPAIQKCLKNMKYTRKKKQLPTQKNLKKKEQSF